MSDTMRDLLRFQRMEATQAEVYGRLAKRQRGKANREVLESISADEVRHVELLADKTGKKVSANSLKVFWFLMMERLFGFTFVIKSMERSEAGAVEAYLAAGLDDIAADEERHEAALVDLLDEKRLQYAGSMVLGMSDALIEITGVLAGLTFAFQDLSMVALAGLVTGVAASFSMGASEFLSVRTDGGDAPLRAAFWTWISYLLTVSLLIAPFLLLGVDDPLRFGLEPHIQALVGTLLVGLLIVAGFTHYVTVVQDLSFRSRFLEMVAILGGVSLISYGIGLGLRAWLTV